MTNKNCSNTDISMIYQDSCPSSPKHIDHLTTDGKYFYKNGLLYAVISKAIHCKGEIRYDVIMISDNKYIDGQKREIIMKH